MNIFELLNQRLSGLDDELYPDPKESNAVFIAGAPRSGTTLLAQMIAASFDLGYVTNAAAAFWEAPACGVAYSRKLIKRRIFTGASDWGGTADPAEPHEFGGFWRRALGYDDMIQKRDHSIDWPGLLRSLDQIAAAWDGRRVTYKVFQLTWHARQFQALRPATKWIWIERDIASNVRSLLRLLEKRQQHWTSSVPLAAIENFNDADSIERVTAQILLINKWLNEQFSSFDDESVLRIELESIHADVDSELQRIASFLDSELNQSMLDQIRTELKASQPIAPEFSHQVNECVQKIESANAS